MNILFLCFLLATSALHTEAVQLKTGHQIFDRYRNVTLDDFDYTYSIYSLNYENGDLELDDGSIWHIEAMNDECKSFYHPKAILLSFLELFAKWKPNDVLIFHKVTDRDSVLVYNMSCDQLLDVLPVSGPKYPKLQIVYVLVDNYACNNGTYTSVFLSDGTMWQTKDSKGILTWKVGDPIHMQKDTPYYSSNTHILMNFTPIKHTSSAIPIFHRLGAWRSSK